MGYFYFILSHDCWFTPLFISIHITVVIVPTIDNFDKKKIKSKTREENVYMYLMNNYINGCFIKMNDFIKE